MEGICLPDGTGLWIPYYQNLHQWGDGGGGAALQISFAVREVRRRIQTVPGFAFDTVSGAIPVPVRRWAGEGGTKMKLLGHNGLQM